MPMTLTEACDRSRSCAAAASQQTLRAHHQHDNQEEEADRVAVEDIGQIRSCRTDFDHAQHQARDQGAAHAAQARPAR